VPSLSFYNWDPPAFELTAEESEAFYPLL